MRKKSLKNSFFRKIGMQTFRLAKRNPIVFQLIQSKAEALHSNSFRTLTKKEDLDA
jgi:hypothetical protein